MSKYICSWFEPYNNSKFRCYHLIDKESGEWKRVYEKNDIIRMLKMNNKCIDNIRLNENGELEYKKPEDTKYVQDIINYLETSFKYFHQQLVLTSEGGKYSFVSKKGQGYQFNNKKGLVAMCGYFRYAYRHKEGYYVDLPFAIVYELLSKKYVFVIPNEDSWMLLDCWSMISHYRSHKYNTVQEAIQASLKSLDAIAKSYIDDDRYSNTNKIPKNQIDAWFETHYPGSGRIAWIKDR